MDVIEGNRVLQSGYWSISGAPCCGPCKQLTPALKKPVRAAQGQGELAGWKYRQAPRTFPADWNSIYPRPVIAFVNGQPRPTASWAALPEARSTGVPSSGLPQGPIGGRKRRSGSNSAEPDAISPSGELTAAARNLYAHSWRMTIRTRPALAGFSPLLISGHRIHRNSEENARPFRKPKRPRRGPSRRRKPREQLA